MKHDSKVWEIDDLRDDKLLPASSAGKKKKSPTVDKIYAAVDSVQSEELRRGRTRGPAYQPRRPDWLVFATFILGPLALLITPPGRRGHFWKIAVATVVGCTAVLALGWYQVPRLLGGGDTAVGIRAFVAAGVFWCGVVLWARAVVIASSACADLRMRVNWHFRRPLTLGIAGLLVPGLGLALDGRPWRASAALVNGCATVFAGFVLVHTLWWWNERRGATVTLLSDRGMDYLILGAALVAIASLIVWIFLALDGVRLAVGPKALRKVAVGDRLHMALLATVVAFIALFDPSTAALQLDNLSGKLRGEGLAVTPFWVERAAVALDRSEPEYVLALANLHEYLGEVEQAQAMRAMLTAKWRSLEREIASGGHPPRNGAVGGIGAAGSTLENDMPAAAGLPVPPASAAHGAPGEGSQPVASNLR